MPGTQRLIDPQGQVREVPNEQASAALSSGWRTPTSEDTAAASSAAANEQDYGGIAGGARAAGYAALRGATLGISDPLFEAAGVPAHDLRGLQEQHPVVSTGSELAGAVLPSLVLPESIAARTPAGAVSNIGRNIVEHASREGAGLLERAAVHSTAAAAEGAFYGGGQYLSDLALGNQPLSVEGFVGSVGKGALFAAPIGGAFTLGEGALIRARSLFPRGEISEAAASGVHKEATSALTSALGDGDQMADKVRQQIALNDAKVGMAQAGEGATRRMFGAADPAAVTDQAAAGADSTQLGEALHAYEASRSQLVDWLHTEADPELAAALEKLSPAGVQRFDVVPRGEFGEPGKGGIKSQDELARLAADRGDVSAPSASQSSLDETKAGKAGLAKGTPVGPVLDVASDSVRSTAFDPMDKIRDRLETMPLTDLQAEVDAVDKLAKEMDARYKANPHEPGLASKSVGLDDRAYEIMNILERRTRSESGYHDLKPLSDLESFKDKALGQFLGSDPHFAANDKVTNADRLAGVSDAIDQRRALQAAVEGRHGVVMAVSDSGGGLDRAIELTKAPSGDHFTDADGAKWTVKDSGNKLSVKTDHLRNRLARAMGSSAPETRIGYIDDVPHLFEKAETKSASLGAATDAKTNPLIDAWARDLANGSGTDEAMRQVLADATPADAVRHIDDLVGKLRDNKGDLHDIIDSSGMSAVAASDAKRRVESQIQWLIEHRDRLSSSASAIAAQQAGRGDDVHDRAPGGEDQSTRGRVRIRDLGSPSFQASAEGDDLEALLRGTKAQLDEGMSLRDIGDSSPARADYVADKAALRARQADEFRSRAPEAKEPTRDIVTDRPPVADLAHGTPAHGTKVGTLDDLNAMLEGVAREPEVPVGSPPTKVDAAVKMRMRIAEREGGVDKALGKTIVDHNMRANVQRMTDDEAIAKLLGQRVGKDVNMGPGLARAAKAIGDFESASADLVDMLGADAPASAAERARGYRGATAHQADGLGASSARTAEGLQDAMAPGGRASDATAVDDEIDRALRKYDATQARKAAQTAQRERLSHKVNAVQDTAKPVPATGGGLLGKATKAGAALEVLKALGVHVPVLSSIPVIGPLLGLFLKAKAVAGILGRKGGSINSTIEGVIASRSAAVQERVAKATAQLLETGAKVAGKASDASAGAATVLAHKLFPGGETPKSKDPVVLYHARMDELSRALAPGAVSQAIGDRIQTADPRLQDAVAGQYERAMQFLYSKAPHEVVLPGMLPGDGKWQPSKAQLNEWAKYVHYVGDPASVLEDLAKGNVTVEGAETLRTVYPQLYALAQQTLIKAAPEMQKTLPYTKRVAMSIMFGVPIDSTLTASHMSFLQHGSLGGTGSGPGGSGAPPVAAPPPAAPGLVGPISIGKQTMTSLDRRAGG